MSGTDFYAPKKDVGLRPFGPTTGLMGSAGRVSGGGTRKRAHQPRRRIASEFRDMAELTRKLDADAMMVSPPQKNRHGGFSAKIQEVGSSGSLKFAYGTMENPAVFRTGMAIEAPRANGPKLGYVLTEKKILNIIQFTKPGEPLFQFLNALQMFMARYAIKSAKERKATILKFIATKGWNPDALTGTNKRAIKTLLQDTPCVTDKCTPQEIDAYVLAIEGHKMWRDFEMGSGNALRPALRIPQSTATNSGLRDPYVKFSNMVWRAKEEYRSLWVKIVEPRTYTTKDGQKRQTMVQLNPDTVVDRPFSGIINAELGDLSVTGFGLGFTIRMKSIVVLDFPQPRVSYGGESWDVVSEEDFARMDTAGGHGSPHDLDEEIEGVPGIGIGTELKTGPTHAEPDAADSGSA